jgi:spoIIIJ-associated protein
MSSLEFEGKNIDKAVKKACDELNMTVDELNYDVLARGSSGIFGLAGAKKAKIRVNLHDKTQESFIGVESADSGSETSVAEKRVAEQTVEDDGFEVRQMEPFEDNPLDIGRDVLQRIVSSITSDAKISVEENSDRVLLKVAGGNAAVLIGKKGQTLEAIQSIVEKVVNKHNNRSQKIRVQVDVEGYLETRKTNLEKLAARLADKSKRIRKPISLGQMSAYDRRIVHMALKDDPDVRTKSRGEGYLRKLVIFPKKKTHRHRQPLR